MSLDPRSEALVRMTNSYGPKQKKIRVLSLLLEGALSAVL